MKNMSKLYMGLLMGLVVSSADYAALSDAGIRAPQDVRIATWANHGNVPIYARALSRVELNTWKDAEATHAFCREILSGKTPGEPPVFAPVWIEGETFTVKCKNQTNGTK